MALAESGTPKGAKQLAVAKACVREATSADAEVRDRILDFCNAHPDALHRSCLEGHLTGSALIVNPKTLEVLLIHHAKLGRWLQPGGHADGEGDLAMVARREAEEETGLGNLQLISPAIDLDIHEIPARGSEPAHVHLDVRYLLLCGQSTEVHLNHESTDARWIPANDPERLIQSEELARLVRRGVALAAALPS